MAAEGATTIALKMTTMLVMPNLRQPAEAAVQAVDVALAEVPAAETKMAVVADQ